MAGRLSRWESSAREAVVEDQPGEGLGPLRVLTTFVLLVVAHLVAIWLVSSWKWVEQNPWVRRALGVVTPRAGSSASLASSVHGNWKGAASRESFATYRVSSGDTLAGIARKFGVKVEELRELNHLPNGQLRVGERIVLPRGARWQEKLQAPSLQESSGLWVVYTVRRGDTLQKIARKTGCSVRFLMKKNGIQDPRRLSVGQRLWVPKGKKSSPPPTEGNGLSGKGNPATGTPAKKGA